MSGKVRRVRLGKRITIGIGGRLGFHYTHECPCHRIFEFGGAYVLVKS